MILIGVRRGNGLWVMWWSWKGGLVGTADSPADGIGIRDVSEGTHLSWVQYLACTCSRWLANSASLLRLRLELEFVNFSLSFRHSSCTSCRYTRGGSLGLCRFGPLFSISSAINLNFRVDLSFSNRFTSVEYTMHGESRLNVLDSRTFYFTHYRQLECPDGSRRSMLFVLEYFFYKLKHI